MKKHLRPKKKPWTWELKRTLKTGVFLAAFLLIAAFRIEAQCTLVCNNPFPSDPMEAAVDQNCEAVITADMVIEDEAACPGPKTLEARTLSGNLIVAGPDPITIPGQYLGTTVGITVIDDNTGNNCTGYLQLTDGLEPFFITCPNLEVSCIADTDPDALGYPIVDDNCDIDVMLTYSESQTGPNCNTPSPYVSVITRTWIATDDFGNQEACTQTISLLKASMEDVDFPPNVTQSCDNPDTSPEVTGRPSIDGVEIMSGNICMFSANYSDVVVFTCAPATHSYTILRTWTVINGCATPNEVEMVVQQINVSDNQNPVVTCQPTITIGTNGSTCDATFLLPAATATDNCSAPGDIDISVTASFGGSGLGPHYNIPAGTYTVTYTAMDECENIGTCTSVLTITDDVPPTAICDEFSVVSLTSAGTAVVPASSFDDGSYDNCGSVTFQGSRNNGLTFSNTITFTCADIGFPVNVILRVYSANNPSLFNDCEVVVNVMDNLPPVVVCPQNQTIDCIETYPFDLTAFGTPIVGDNCGAEIIASDTTYNLSNCGEGTIVRSWTVQDPSGHSASCSQTLTVVNQTPFNGALIQWPLDYTENNTCVTADQLDPEDLPSIYSEPILPDVNCALLATNYSDQVFFIAYPACYKIIRTWTVMDWCTYNPAEPAQGGIWYHTQVIKVNDNIAPEFQTLPPDTVYASVDVNCQFGPVTLPVVTATDCSPNIIITNNSPYANSGGANASGMYPLGTTTVKYTAKDGCGNSALFILTVIVEDNTPPVLACEDLVTDLGVVQGGGVQVTVGADAFLEYYYDNCSAEPDIDIFIRRRDPLASGPPATTSLTFNCDDINLPVKVEVWVVDEAGNADFCIVDAIIQDNNNLCPMQTTFTIAGEILTEEGDEVDNVLVDLSGWPVTSAPGSPFVFSNLPGNYDYTLAPQKLEDASNGVTTYDLVLISRHILGVQLLDSPYKIIAADANRTGSVSTTDMVAIRKLILGLEDTFPGNPSWRFVDKDYLFPDPANPFSQIFPEVININNLSADELYADFVAVKVGDVNGTASPNLMTGEVEERTAGVLELRVDDLEVKAGQRYEVPVYAHNFEDILGFQFTLNLAPGKLNWLEMDACDLPNLGMENIGDRYAGEGQITFSWNAATGLSLDKEHCIFKLHLEALDNGNLMNWLHIGSERLRSEAYVGNGTVQTVQFRPSEELAQGLKLYQNRPNPFNRSTTIGFAFDQETQGSLVVFDLEGREVFRYNGTWSPGYHELSLGRDQLPQSGMYFYRLETAAWTEVRKMILVD